MRCNALLLAMVAFLLALVSCNRSFVTLDYTNASNEVPQLGNLTFRFSKALVADSLLNQWDSTKYISFNPEIPGRFRWEHPDELSFSPSRPLNPATSYEATLNDDILQYTKYGQIKEGDHIKFRTPDLKVENTNTAWVLQDEQSKSAAPQIDLYFNYPVNPNDLKDRLKIEVDGKQTAFSLQTLSAQTRISARLLNIRPEDRDYDIKLAIDKGLRPEGGKNVTTQVAEISSGLSSPFVLNINDISSEHDGTTGTVLVKTSQRPVNVNLSPYLAFKPAVKFSVELTEEGFLVSSDAFDPAKSYELTIMKGLRGKLGGTLNEGYTNNLAFGALKPSISFANRKAIFLSAQGSKNIEVRITNVPKLKVIISKIYENNLIAAEHYGYYPKVTSGEDNRDYEGELGDATAGDVIYEKEIDARSLPKYGNSRLFNFNITDRLQGFKGIYHISIRSSEEYWINDSRFISLSDIGLIAKEGKDKMYVFANSLRTANPVNGVNVLVYGNNNQLLGMGPTNAEGVAEIAYTRKEFAGFRSALVIAKTADDFNYLPFASTKVNTTRFDAGGKQTNATGLDAFIYGERDIYRPGENVNFSVIVRDKTWSSPGELPLKLKFLMPNGKEFKTFRKTLNAEGSIEGSIEIASSAITGTYSLEVYTSNDLLLSSKVFMIEEFVPDRIKVSAQLNKPVFKPGETATLQLNAVNFFGPPAANRNYETEIQTRQKLFNPKKFNTYNFTFANQTSFFDKVVKEGKTDENGGATAIYEVPKTYSNVGILQVVFYATVFDETGRPVSRSTTADILTQPVFLGLGNDESGYYPLNQVVKFPLVALDVNESIANGTAANIKVIRHEYKTVLAKTGSYFRYDSQKEEKLISDNTVTINGENTMFSFVPRSPGEYEIRLSLPGSNSYVSKSFYSYGNWGSANNSFEVNTEGNVEIVTDKASYNSGEAAKVLFKTPFSGRMLVTMETDKVVWHQYVQVEKRSLSMDLKITADHLPNVYITATLIKPHDVSDIPLTVAHGYLSVKVEEKNRKMAVQVLAQKSARSKTHQKITIRSAPGSYVTLAAVDNGVLQVSDFKTPDPYDYFYSKHALEVNGYDIYPLLYPEIKPKLSSTGGDADPEMSKRTNPIPNKRVKIVSYWSGITKANGNGETNIEFDIPQYSGQLRLMALAYKNNSFGSGEASITVADPIVLSTALPRFLSPGDTMNVPVNISNTTARSTTAVATISTSGPLRVVGNNSQSVTLAANAESRPIFKVVASSVVNAGKVKTEVQGLGEKFTSETDITVRPASTLQQLTGSGSISGNSSLNLQMPANDFLPGSSKYRLVISRSPVMELGSQLNYLVQFPYGCTEQVISAAFPQLYFGELASMMKTNAPAAGNSNVNIQEAIRKIQLRQLYNGAVLLWDNEGTENWWVTIYAAHFLLEAKKAGYDVDPSLFETLLGYINNKLRNRQTITYYYNRDQQRKIAPKEVPYSLYVLAVTGRANVSVMNYYKANPQLLALDGRYLLSAAFAVAGDKTRFRELLPSSFNGEESLPQTGGSFYSDIRDEAIALDVLLDVDPANTQIPVMSRHVAQKLKQRTWYNTQESAFSFLALGKLARLSAKSTVSAEIRANNKVVGRVTSDAVSFSSKELGGNNPVITTKGEGRLYYWWQAEGISASGAYKEEDNFLKVRRKFFDRFGRLVNTNNFQQNELIVVQLTIEKSYSGKLDNIVLTDLLPAGFEIENPRTKEIPGMDWIKDSDTPTQLDVRDDRINLFVDLTRNKQVYYYAVRAVSPGTFHMGPVSADALYNGDYHSYNGGGTIRVVP